MSEKGYMNLWNITTWQQGAAVNNESVNLDNMILLYLINSNMQHYKKIFKTYFKYFIIPSIV
jgi:hypothetical protein